MAAYHRSIPQFDNQIARIIRFAESFERAMRPFVEEAKRHEQYGEDRVFEFIFDGMQRDIARRIAPDLDVDTIAPGVLRKKIAVVIRWQRKPM